MWCERDPVVQLGRSLNIGNVCIRVQRSHSFMFCTEVSNAGFRTATLLPLRLVGAALRQASFITIVSCTQEDASWWVVNRRQTCEWNPYSKQRVRERKQVFFFAWLSNICSWSDFRTSPPLVRWTPRTHVVWSCCCSVSSSESTRLWDLLETLHARRLSSTPTGAVPTLFLVPCCVFFFRDTIFDYWLRLCLLCRETEGALSRLIRSFMIIFCKSSLIKTLKMEQERPIHYCIWFDTGRARFHYNNFPCLDSNVMNGINSDVDLFICHYICNITWTFQ